MQNLMRHLTYFKGILANHCIEVVPWPTPGWQIPLTIGDNLEDLEQIHKAQLEQQKEKRQKQITLLERLLDRRKVERQMVLLWSSTQLHFAQLA
ncbi:hypothetical protein B0A54_17681 [Friedmanniomyces endolithicus]|uniref:Uncharacterized protein n=1 Tax=Friedmanniomyces endolithicus TaxID=329885 RepID=A0A4U0TT87_9PEZI|nr:hypothetical protein B0A54_17681 [Friedmanniomyces endolithicus]